MIIIVTFLSFILEFVFNYFFRGSLFLPLTILTAVVVLRPYFRDISWYYVFCGVVGFLYDFVYTGNFFMSSVFYLIIGFVVNLISFNMPNNVFVSIFEVILSIIFYRLMCFLFMFFNGFVDFSGFSLFKSIYCSFLLNFIYGIILYFILYFVSKKFNIKRIN